MDAAVPWRVRDAALLCALGFGVLLLSLLGTLGLYRLQGPPAALPAQPPPALAALATDLCYLVILAGVWLLVVRRYAVGWDAIGLRLPSREALPAALGLCLLLAAATVALLYGMSWWLGTLGLHARITAQSDVPPVGDPLFAVAVLGSVVLTPVAEELLFRGILYQSLRKHVGVVLGAGSSAILFALLHLRLAAIPEFLILGIMLAIAFERTRSLYPSMVMHAAYNAAIILFALHAI